MPHPKKKWTDAETADLVKMWAADTAIKTIAVRLGRRPEIIRAKISRLRSTRPELAKHLKYRIEFPGGKLKTKDIPKIRKDTRSLRLIGKDYHVSAVTIFKVKNGETWKDA